MQLISSLLRRQYFIVCCSQLTYNMYDVSILQDNELNVRIYCEEQDDVQNETWQVVVK